jgi:hypothetical protein
VLLQSSDPDDTRWHAGERESARLWAKVGMRRLLSAMAAARPPVYVAPNQLLCSRFASARCKSAPNIGSYSLLVQRSACRGWHSG